MRKTAASAVLLSTALSASLAIIAPTIAHAQAANSESVQEASDPGDTPTQMTPTLTAAIAAKPSVTAESVLDYVEARRNETAQTARKLWELAEVGYLEEKSSKLLQDTLKAEGFAIEAGVADIPTAFTASYGESGPVIAILAEFDALPGINQDGQRQFARPVPGKTAGHACGHNLFGAGSAEAAIAGEEMAGGVGDAGRRPALRHAGRGRRIRQGLYGPRRPFRRCRHHTSLACG